MTVGGYSRATRIRLRSKTEQIVIVQELPPKNGIRVERDIPINGTITSLALDFPSGCKNYVTLAAGHGTKQFCPSAGTLALDTATPMVIPVSERVTTAEKFWVVLENGDRVNPHTITILVTIEK